MTPLIMVLIEVNQVMTLKMLKRWPLDAASYNQRPFLFPVNNYNSLILYFTLTVFCKSLSHRESLSTHYDLYYYQCKAGSSWQIWIIKTFFFLQPQL